MTKKSGGKLLVVEDEVVIALRLQQRLTSLGFDVVGVAYSGEEAVETARDLKPDLILMDIMIPGRLDGIEAAKIIKVELNIPVIFLTAFSEDTVIERAREAQPYGYILKPFQDREVKATVEIALYKKGIEEKLRKAHNELEQRIKERTVDLNKALKSVKHSEQELSHRKMELELLNKELMETNQAVSVLARNIDKKKEDLEKKIFKMCNGKLLPILKRLQKDVFCQKRQADLELVINYLDEIINDSPSPHDIYSQLSDQEQRVALMIKNGLTSQQIADLLCISLYTVKTHRKNIRKKLKIDNTNVNLISYLKSKFKDQS
jgi:DNA-binding NarL/FixJ family response regulator